MIAVVIKYVLVAGAAFGAGYYVARMRLEKHYFTMLAHETDEAREFYRRKYKEEAAKQGEDPETTQAAIDAAEAMAKYSGLNIGPSILTQEMTAAVERAEEFKEAADLANPEVKEHLLESFPAETAETHVHDNGGTQLAVSQTVPTQYNNISTPEKPKKSSPEKSEAPYEITEEDFINNDTGYKQFSFTYFQGDDVLANASDEPVDEEARIASLGKDLLEDLKVGGLDTMYVRNDVGRWEFEVARSAGKFSVEVLSESG